MPKRPATDLGVVPSAAERAAPTSLLFSVLGVMKEAYRPMPKELWGLSKATDLLVPRGFVIDEESLSRYYLRAGGERRKLYPIASIRTADGFNKPLRILPGVIWIMFGREFTHSVVIPAGVKTIIFNDMEYNLKEKDEEDDDLNEEEFLAAIEEVERGSQFNQVLTLPEGLQDICFGKAFNNPIIFPSSVISIRFGKAFNQPVVLPPKLESLDFNDEGEFNQPLTLPESLRTLILSGKFNYPIDLPASLECVFFQEEYNQPLELPDGLRGLSLSCVESRHPVSLPDSIQELAVRCNNPITRMSKNLRSLEVSSDFTQQFVVPEGLVELQWHPNRPVDLPSTLKHLVLGDEFHQALVLPAGLEIVAFQGEYNHPLILPEGCKRFDEDDDYSAEMDSFFL